MNTVVHIGFPKAASSWLQGSLFPAVKNFRQAEGVVISDKLLKPGAFRFDPQECRDFFAGYTDKSILISEERFLGSFNLGWNNGAYSKELAGRLKSVFPEAAIMLVIRNQADIIASAYAQYIKDGGTISINRYLCRPANFTFQNILKFSFEQLEYDRIIRFYDSLFPGKVRAYLFEKLSEDPGSFIQQMAIDHDFELDREMISYHPRNRRYSRMVMTLARFTNILTRNGSLNKYYLMHIPGFHSFSKRAWKAISRTGIPGRHASTEKILGKGNLDKINSYYTDPNRNLGRFVPMEDLKRFNYPI